MLIDKDIKWDIEIIRYNTYQVVDSIVEAAHNNDEAMLNSYYEQYSKYDRLLSLAMTLLVDYKKDNFDWKFLAEKRRLCTMDFDWFKKELEENGIKKEDYFRKVG